MIQHRLPQVNVDKVQGLEQYRGKCQPVFLLYRVSGTYGSHDSCSCLHAIHSCKTVQAGGSQLPAIYEALSPGMMITGIHILLPDVYAVLVCMQDSAVLQTVTGVQTPSLTQLITSLSDPASKLSV
eukprot:GHRR01035426.1.p1 GENE.GHRR01035426.1~~GHRR01035426.1.p1  ORF type:complete len:126 (-),score=23.29 GHRR01035426.1:36-413(-)